MSVVCMNRQFISGTDASKTVVNQLKMMLELEDPNTMTSYQRLMKKWNKLREKSLLIVKSLLEKLLKKLVFHMDYAKLFSLMFWA